MCFRKYIYEVPASTARICFILNIFLPGWGTCVQSYYGPDGCSWGTFGVALLQMITVFILVGWVWAIWHGWQVMKQSDKSVAQ